MPNGARFGRWTWLNPSIDQPLANALAITPASSLELVIAIENGYLPGGIPSNQMPIAVYYPNPRFLNPTTMPHGSGQFLFLTEGGEGSGSAQEHARLNLADQADAGFGGNLHPTARDVFRYRADLQTRIESGEADDNEIDLSEGIDIVWCPAEGASFSPSPNRPSSTADDDIDPDSGLKHQPTNPHHPGHDQTHTGHLSSAHYQTRNDFGNGLIYTVDRSRAHAGDKELHKLWIVNTKGIWRKYPNVVDWNNPSSVEKLNKYREQGFQRGEWPAKRQEARPKYTNKQRKWLFNNYVAPNHGERPPSPTTMADVTDAFDRRFPSTNPRNIGGITSLYDRLRGEYKDNDGKMKTDNQDEEMTDQE